MKTIGVSRIMSRIHRDLGFYVEVADVAEWMGDVADAIGVPALHDEGVAFIEVKNHKAEMPDYLHAIIQIARNNAYSPELPIECGEVVSEVVEDVSKDCGCKPKSFPCSPWAEEKPEYTFNRIVLDLQLNHSLWVSSSNWRRQWTPVRLATHSFFNSVVCTEVDAENLYISAKDEYNIDGSTLIFSFKEGLVAVSYVKQKVDEEGLPLFPDHMSFVKAVIAYVRYMYLSKQADQDPRILRQAEKAEADYHWYVQQAANKLQMPMTVDQMENRQAMRSYLLPREHRYSSFFGNANSYENRTWNKRRTWR